MLINAFPLQNKVKQVCLVQFRIKDVVETVSKGRGMLQSMCTLSHTAGTCRDEGES